jgi:hypothetical protein
VVAPLGVPLSVGGGTVVGGTVVGGPAGSVVGGTVVGGAAVGELAGSVVGATEGDAAELESGRETGGELTPASELTPVPEPLVVPEPLPVSEPVPDSHDVEVGVEAVVRERVAPEELPSDGSPSNFCLEAAWTSEGGAGRSSSPWLARGRSTTTVTFCTTTTTTKCWTAAGAGCTTVTLSGCNRGHVLPT